MIDFLAAIDSGCMYRMLFLRLFLLQRRAPAVLRDLFAGSVVLCRKLSRSCSATITALKGSILCGIAMGGDRKRHGKVGMQMQSSRRRKSPIQSHDGREEMQAFVFNSWRSLSFFHFSNEESEILQSFQPPLLLKCSLRIHRRFWCWRWPVALILSLSDFGHP